MGNDQSIEVKLSQSYIDRFCKILSSEELKNIKAAANTKIVDPLSRQTNANCTKKRKIISWTYPPKVNKSNFNSEGNVKQPIAKKIVLINDKIESKNDKQDVCKMLPTEELQSIKQTDENSKAIDLLSRQTSANCLKTSELVSWKYPPKVNESNSNLERNAIQPIAKRVVLINNKIQSKINKQEVGKTLSTEELKSINQRNENTKDAYLSRQTSANCLKKSEFVSWKYPPKVNKSISNLEENAKQPIVKRIVLINNKIQSKINKQEVGKTLPTEELKSIKQRDENTKDADLSRQTNCLKKNDLVSWSYRLKVNESNSNLEGNAKKSIVKRVVLINDKIESKINKQQEDCKILSAEELRNMKQINENTKDADILSRQTGANCNKKREVVSWKYPPKVNESNSNLEGNAKKLIIKRVVLVNDKIESTINKQQEVGKMLSTEELKSIKQTTENTKNTDPFSRQTGANCNNKREGVSWKYSLKVNESNSSLEENAKQSIVKSVALINDKIELLNKQQEVCKMLPTAELKSMKQRDENTKDVDLLSRETSANCLKKSELVSLKYPRKVNKSNALKENVKQLIVKRIILVNDNIELDSDKEEEVCNSSEKSKGDKQTDENTKDVDPLSIQTSVNSLKRKKVSRKDTSKVNESDSDLEEDDEEPKIKTIVLINDDKIPRTNKQENENKKNERRCSSRQSSKKKKSSKKQTTKVTESNAEDVEESQPKIVWVGSINDKEFTCKFCNKSFCSPNNFVDHECTVGKRYTCLLCFAEFTRNSSLNRHLKQTHDREKKHVCDICNKSFSERVYLENHLRKHIGERPYLCDLCKKAFHSKLGLKYHIKTHIGDFKHKCNYCHKKFLDKTNMLAHLTTHTGEKNYKCDICGRRFGTMPALIHHKVVHSEAKTYTCPCGKRYKHKYSLRRHIGLEMCPYSVKLKLNGIEPDLNLILDNLNMFDL